MICRSLSSFQEVGATFALTRISFKLLALLNPTIEILAKPFHVFYKVLIVGVLEIFKYIFKFRKHWTTSNIKTKPTVISYMLSLV